VGDRGCLAAGVDHEGERPGTVDHYGKREAAVAFFLKRDDFRSRADQGGGGRRLGGKRSGTKRHQAGHHTRVHNVSPTRQDRHGPAGRCDHITTGEGVPTGNANQTGRLESQSNR
jgi:hypothetical protein